MICEHLLLELAGLLSIDGLAENFIYGYGKRVVGGVGWSDQDTGAELLDSFHTEILSNVVRDADKRNAMTEGLVGDDVAAMADYEPGLFYSLEGWHVGREVKIFWRSSRNRPSGGGYEYPDRLSAEYVEEDRKNIRIA